MGLTYSDARWFRKLVLGAVLLGVAACSEQLTGVLSPPSFDIWSVTPSGNPIKPWTGRSGSAAISAQAAFGDGASATLTVTSYRVLDKNLGTISTDPAGCITKIQVKAFDPSGTQLWVRNYNNLSPVPPYTYTITYANGELLPGYRLHVQANVSCIDPRRTDVVEVEGTAAPSVTDPRVGAVRLPASTGVGQPTSISTVVTVPVGYLGATGTCELYVGTSNEPVAALAKTVAAGSGVSCDFVTSFTSEGTVDVTVRFLNVSPEDANTANNTATASITVTALSVFQPKFSISAVLYDDTITYHELTAQSTRAIQRANQLYDTLRTPGTLLDTLYSSTDRVGNLQHAQFTGIINSTVQFPLRRLAVTQRTNGTPTETVYHGDAWANVRGQPGSAGAECAVLPTLPSGITLEVCSYEPTSTQPYGRTIIRYSRDAESAASGEQWYQVDYRPGADTPLATCDITSTDPGAQCYTIRTPVGARLTPYGDRYAFDVVLDDARYTYSSHVVINLTRALLSQGEPATCTLTLLTDQATGEPLRFRFCEGTTDDRVRLSGPEASLYGLTTPVP